MTTLSTRPPGPKSHGLIGNFPMGSPDPLSLIKQWADRYGDIFHYRVLHRHVYYLNHPDFVKHVLSTDAQNFIKGEAVRFNRRIFGNGLVSNEGKSWSHQRRIIQPAFNHERIGAYAGIMTDYAERTIADWQDGEARDIHQDMMRLTLEIVAMALFSVEIASQTDRISIALNTLMEASSGARMLLPPTLRLIPTPGNLRLLRATRQLDRIVCAMIDQRRATPSDSHSDLLGTLLRARGEDGELLSTRQVRDEVMTLLLAGHETTAVSLSWTWYLLSQHPDVEKKLWCELRNVLNGRSPRMQDLPQLPYTQRVVKEGMRLYPPVWAMVRNPVEDCEIGGYVVPAGVTVVMSQWIMHRDARYYDEPERFNPDRWLEERAKSAPRYSYFPFGGGPRVCIGASFASTETALVLATIAQKYQVRMAPDSVRPRHGIKVILARR